MSDLADNLTDAARRQDRAQAKLEGAHDAASMTEALKLEALAALTRAVRAVPDEAYAALVRALVTAAIGWLAPAAEERRP